MVSLAQTCEECVDFGRSCIAAHEGEAGYMSFVFVEQPVHRFVGQCFAAVGPEVLGVAPRATAGASREVDGKRYLVGDFLEDYCGVGVFQHGGRLV